MSYTIAMHYCGDTMVDFSFFQTATTCGMENTQLTSNCENPEVSQKSCCSDKQVGVHGQNEFKDIFKTLTFEQQLFVAALTYSYIQLFEGADASAIPFVAYSPPFVKRDVQVLHQSFLI